MLAVAAELTRQLAEQQVHMLAGDFARAKAEALALVPRVDALGIPSLQALAHLNYGQLLRTMSEPSRAELERAAQLAVAHRLDRLAAEALAYVALAAGSEGSTDAVTTLVPLARAAAQRLHDRKAELATDIVVARALIRAHKFEDAATACQAALGVAPQIDALQVHDAEDCVVESLQPLGQYSELQPVLARLIAYTEDKIGKDNAIEADYLEVQVAIDVQNNHPADARAHAEHVLAIRQRVYPPAHFKIATAIALIGNADLAEGKPEEARAKFEQALAMIDDKSIEHIAMLDELNTRLAFIDGDSPDSERHAAALAHIERVVSLVRTRVGSDTVELALALLNDGMLQGPAKPDAALAMFGEARTILEHNHDKRVTSVACAAAFVGVTAKRYREGLAAGEACLAAVDADTPPPQVAEEKQLVAIALAETHGNRVRARKLAREARAVFATLGPMAAQQVAELDAWLKTH